MKNNLPPGVSVFDEHINPSDGDVCECCGAYMEAKGRTVSYGGDGFGDKCCGLADGEGVVWCEECGAAYCAGERCPEQDYVSTEDNHE